MNKSLIFDTIFTMKPARDSYSGWTIIGSPKKYIGLRKSFLLFVQEKIDLKR